MEASAFDERPAKRCRWTPDDPPTPVCPSDGEFPIPQPCFPSKCYSEVPFAQRSSPKRLRLGVDFEDDERGMAYPPEGDSFSGSSEPDVESFSEDGMASSFSGDNLSSSYEGDNESHFGSDGSSDNEGSDMDLISGSFEDDMGEEDDKLSSGYEGDIESFIGFGSDEVDSFCEEEDSFCDEEDSFTSSFLEWYYRDLSERMEWFSSFSDNDNDDDMESSFPDNDSDDDMDFFVNDENFPPPNPNV